MNYITGDDVKIIGNQYYYIMMNTILGTFFSTTYKSNCQGSTLMCLHNVKGEAGEKVVRCDRSINCTYSSFSNCGNATQGNTNTSGMTKT